MGLGKRGRTIRGSRKSPPRSTSRIVKPTPGTSIAMPLLPLPPNFPKVKQEPLDDLMALVKTEEEAAQPLPVISSTFSVPKPPTTLIPISNASKIVKKPIEGLVTMVQQPVRKTHSPILQNSVVVPLTTSSLTSSSSSTTQLVAPTTTTLTTLPTLTRPRVLSSVPTKVVITSDTFRSRPEYLPQSSHIPVAVQPQQPQQPTILIQRPPGLQQQPQPQQRVVLLQPSIPHPRRPDNIKVFQVKR